MKDCRGGLLAGCLAATLGCAPGVVFRPTDEGYRPVPRATRPLVFLQEPPPQRYRAVGVLIVESRGLTDRELLDCATAQGQKLGCDYLISPDLVQQSRRSWRPRYRLVHGGGGDGPSHHAVPEGRVETQSFVCGVREGVPAEPVPA